MKFQSSRRFFLRIASASALLISSTFALGQTATQDAPDLSSDAAKRLEWLKSRTPPPPARRANFRTSTNRLRLTDAPAPAAPPVREEAPPKRTTEEPAPAPRSTESQPPAASTPATPAPTTTQSSKKKTEPAPTPAARNSIATAPKATPAKAPAEPTPVVRTSPPETAKKRIAAESTPKARTSVAVVPKATPEPTPIARTSTPETSKKRVAAESTPAAPTTTAKASKTTPAKAQPEPTPAPVVRNTLPEISKKHIAAAPSPTPPPPIATGPKSTLTKAKTDPALEARLEINRPIEFKTSNTRAVPSARTASDGRYPWRTGIVTTVFWVGEPVGGNNFTHNRSSSWDVNWAVNFGGYDNPNPEARRNYIAARFTPRQNPFYIALPYNDVTRGTTKPEAKMVIPWFREAFQREGLSVCRDRWVAVRSASGKVAYAQWSDCGPFRTDHWQYVFGKEKPKPNLNQGAGLDVSPAMRDYLGLDGTDLTDWKFVDFKDVPHGPWSLYGENNPFTQKSGRASKRVAKTSSPRSSTTLARNP